MLLSIITVNLNNQKGLKNTIDSVIQQTNNDFEYLIIDGGSADGSKEIIAANQHQINYWISEPDKGIYNAMNKGIAKATGKYLLFLNSGDTLSNSNTIAQLKPHLKNSDLYYTHAKVIKKSEKNFFYVFYPKKISFKYLIMRSLNHQNSILKKTAITQLGGYSEAYQIVSDWALMLAMFREQHQFTFIPNLIISNFEDGGFSTDYKKQKAECTHVVSKYYPEYLPYYTAKKSANNYRIQKVWYWLTYRLNHHTYYWIQKYHEACYLRSLNS